jgi:hypothetical protein
VSFLALEGVKASTGLRLVRISRAESVAVYVGVMRKGDRRKMVVCSGFLRKMIRGENEEV